MVIEMKINNYLNKKKEFEFYVLNITKKTPDYNDIINVFLESIIDPCVIEEKDYTLVLSSVYNNDVSLLVEAIVEDFGINLKVFRSNKIQIQNVNFIDELLNIYLKYKDQINQNYIGVRSLVECIIDKNYNDLEKIKPIILNKIINDHKLYEIINGMFVKDLNVCKTADYVYMHRNTINNKLIVIKEETGLDIQKFQDAVMLYVLIKK